MEYPEKEIIALCVISMAAVVSVREMKNGKLNRAVFIIVQGLALAVSLGTIVSKLTVSFYSADSDIAQWHHLALACGALLLTLVLSNFKEADSQQVAPQKY